MPTKKAAKKSARKSSAARTTSSSTRGSAPRSSSAKKKSSGRKYSPAASKNVEEEMHEFKRGTLRTSTGKKVTNPKQAIAIGLSEARRSGKKVPSPKKSSR